MEVEALRREQAAVKPRVQQPRPKTAPRKEKYRAPVLSQQHRKMKRILDYTILLFALPFVLPLCLITAILIKLDSRGPVLFKQERVGRSGQIFTMYKFRSMTIDAEHNGNRFASENDARVTKLGNFIRKYRIDELPQFWNVLRGEMSVIGPRPEQVSFVEYFNEEIERYDHRHVVKPGITGLAQVHMGYAASTRTTQMKLNYDLFYIKHYSLRMDLMIVLKTLRTILTGFGSR